jgi:hypothetical protein
VLSGLSSPPLFGVAVALATPFIVSDPVSEGTAPRMDATPKYLPLKRKSVQRATQSWLHNREKCIACEESNAGITLALARQGATQAQVLKQTGHAKRLSNAGGGASATQGKGAHAPYTRALVDSRYRQGDEPVCSKTVAGSCVGADPLHRSATKTAMMPVASSRLPPRQPADKTAGKPGRTLRCTTPLGIRRRRCVRGDDNPRN